MSKVDMTRYLECPRCHTFQVTISPCQKCMARRLAAEGTLPESGIAPYNPFSALSAERRKETKKPSKPKESEDDKRKRLKALAQLGYEAKSARNITTKVPLIVSELSDGEPHKLSMLMRRRIIPFGTTLTRYGPTRTMMQMGLLECSKDGPNHNSPVRIWIPALKIQDAIEYAEGLKNDKNQRR